MPYGKICRVVLRAIVGEQVIIVVMFVVTSTYILSMYTYICTPF